MANRKTYQPPRTDSDDGPSRDPARLTKIQKKRKLDERAGRAAQRVGRKSLLLVFALVCIFVLIIIFPRWFQKLRIAYSTLSHDKGEIMATKFYDLKPLDSKGELFDFKQLNGKVVLVVNVASQCGYTPQYKGLESLYKKHKDRGFVVVGFPSNQFGYQEPGSNDEIQQFCRLNYGVTFPVLAKIDVNGDEADPVYQYLRKNRSQIQWNFEKFLINRKGEIVNHYMTITEPKDLEHDLEKELAK